MHMIDKMAKENIQAEARSPTPTVDTVEREAKFLKKWSRGKPIRRESDASTFWSAGKFMTKITFKMAEALEKGGHAKLQGDPRKAGATLTMK